MPEKSNDKNPLSNKTTANDKGKLGKHKMSTWKQKDTKTKAVKVDNSRSKGFGS